MPLSLRCRDTPPNSGALCHNQTMRSCAVYAAPSNNLGTLRYILVMLQIVGGWQAIQFISAAPPIYICRLPTPCII